MQNEDDAVRVWFRLLRLNTRIRLAMTFRLKKLNLSAAQCDVLTTLTEAEGISQQELAKRLYVTKGNISGLVDRLVESGLVERRSLNGDRRSHAIFLTPDGTRMAQTGIAAQRDFVARSLGRMDVASLHAFETLLIGARNRVREAAMADEAEDGQGNAG